jgi:hypothetical protein
MRLAGTFTPKRCAYHWLMRSRSGCSPSAGVYWVAPSLNGLFGCLLHQGRRREVRLADIQKDHGRIGVRHLTGEA